MQARNNRSGSGIGRNWGISNLSFRFNLLERETTRKPDQMRLDSQRSVEESVGRFLLSFLSWRMISWTIDLEIGRFESFSKESSEIIVLLRRQSRL